MDNTIKEFSTDSLALAPYLFLKGLKYLRAEVSVGKGNRKRIFFVFEDLKGVGKDLEKSFLNSAEKKYKDCWMYLRNQLKIAQDKDKLTG
ncbi:MAG: hypothetical protein DRI65_10440 [Chloroflexota bacterium]|nr:MAG: hypothetical protein DRI65_10440 [Chloroflexota bacterium]